MQCCPTQEHLKLAVWHIPFEHFNIANRNDDLLATVRGMEVRRLVIASIDIDFDAAEHADCRHVGLLIT